MKLSLSRSLFRSQVVLVALASFCIALIPQGHRAIAQAPNTESAVMQTTTTESDAPKMSNDQLDSLVAPIALYPDPLLAQTLAASTYPLEVVQLKQWMERNKKLKDKALADAVAKQPWDPSVQALAAAPDVVERLAGNIAWTTDLGNAFLAQQSDVMDAIQRMRGKAESKGTLKTSAQQTVETRTVEDGKQVIVVEPADPEVVYVPSYDPEVVYGPAPVGYPYYPYTYAGYYPGMALAWGAAGFALGAWAGGYWGHCDWNHGDIDINNKNNFNRNVNRDTNRNTNRGQGRDGKWQHNPQHRGNAPYGDRKTADRFGGNASQRPAGGNRGQAGANRPGRGTGGGNVASTRPGGGKANRAGSGTASRPGGGTANRPGSGGSRPGGSGATANRPTGGGSRPSTMPANRSSSRSSQVGSRNVSSRPSYSSSRGGGFGGGSGSAARASSSRGGRSMGGGGMSRGGGGRGGGGGRR